MSLDRFRKTGRMDYWLLFFVFILCVFGLMMIYSASAVLSFEQYGVNNFFFKKQLTSFIIGFIVLIIASQIDYRFWQKYAFWFLVTAVALLVSVFILSPEIAGAQRWLHIGSISFQPSEIAKFSFIIYLAAWLAKRKEHIQDFRYSFVPFAIILGLISFLIIKQPDMGTMTVIVAIAVTMFFVSGASIWHLAVGGAALFGMFLLLIKMSPYRMQRLMVFLNPTAEKLGAGYHINQALLAIGSGGLFGLGFGQSKQKFLYLPEPHTDSIFAIITEELGFLRAILVFVVFTIIVLRGFKIAKNAPDDFAKYLAVGITAWIVIQFLINIGAMLGILPLTGVTLPFVSYGGSSLIMLLAGVGILLNISKHSNR